MTVAVVTVAPAPPEVLGRFETGARELAAEDGIIPEELVQRANPIPFFVTDLRTLPDASADADAWRFVVLTKRGPLWMDVAQGEVSGVLRGEGIDGLLRACSAARRMARRERSPSSPPRRSWRRPCASPGTRTPSGSRVRKRRG